MPQLAAVYVNLVKIDNVLEPAQRQWPTAIPDLLDLVASAGSEQDG
jgi:hypothetical protein